MGSYASTLAMCQETARMADGKKKIVVVVSEALHREAKIKAAKTGKPMAQVMREALEEWTADEPDPEKCRRCAGNRIRARRAGRRQGSDILAPGFAGR